jgi:Zn ribbon nucleic-acid-binding protein
MHLFCTSGAGPSQLPNAGEVNPTSSEVDDAELWPESAVVEQESNQCYQMFEEEDEEQERLMLSRIMGMNLDNVQALQSNVSKKKSAPKKPPIALCSTCGKEYTTLDGYIKHRMSHAMAGKRVTFLKLP